MAHYQYVKLTTGPQGTQGTQGYQGYQGPAGAGAGFTGTVGTLPKFTGTGTTIGDSVVVESGGRISVGAFTSSAKFEINAGTLGGTLGNYLPAQNIYAGNGNNEYFEMGSLRTANGGDWQSAGFRMQEKIDSTWMGYIQFNGSGNDYGITFGTGSSTVSRQAVLERMRITSAGNVGINNTDPQATLDIVTPGSTQTAILARGNDANFRLIARQQNSTNTTGAPVGELGLDHITTRNAAIRFHRGGNTTGGFITLTTNDGSEQVRINSSGNVGIGTTSDSGHKLDVAGAIRNVLQDPTGIGGITTKFLSYAISPYGLIFRAYATGQLSIQNQREANDAEVFPLILQPNGSNVGIGTLTPSVKLDVVDTVSAPTLRLANTPAGGYGGGGNIVFEGGYNDYVSGAISWKNGVTTRGKIEYIAGNRTMNIYSENYTTFTFAYTGEIMRITNEGYVGIGTTSPTAKVHAKSTGAVTSPITIFNDTFARTPLSPGGIPTTVTYTATNGAVIEAIGSNPYALSLPRSSVYQYATAITPAFPTNNYNPVLNVNTGVLHWSVNTRQSNSSIPTGFAPGQFGQAVILACNTVNPALSTAFGYALTYGNLGTNQWSLVRFQNGLNSNSNITTLVSTTNIGGSNTCFYSLKVTYTPATNSWSLYVRIDGCSGAGTVWGNPTTTTTLIGTVVNSTYTASSLPYFGFVYNSTTTGNSHFSNYSLINAGTTTYPDSVKVEDGNFKQLNGFAILQNLATLDAATDSVAAGLNVPLYGVYRTGNVLRVRTGSNVDGIVFTTGAQSIDGAKTFLQNVTAPGFFNSSDARLKDVIDRDGDTVKFTWKDGRDSKIHIGYIAQEVQELYPDQVTKGDDGMLTVNYIEVLVAKIQELENRIKQLEK